MVAAAALVVLAVGVPWGLAQFVGWPLPDHLPRWDEVRAVLLGPLSPYLLLDILATLCWLAWTAFAVDLLLCLTESMRHLRLPIAPGARPTRALAAVLVTAIAVAVLGNRVAGAVMRVEPVQAGVVPQVVVTALTWPERPPYLQMAATQRADLPPSVVVRAPANGVHDSLWRIAARELGDGRRWPEIFEINRGMPQPYGRVFTRPSLIFPGQVLRLPNLVSPDTARDAAVVAPPGAGASPPPGPAPGNAAEPRDGGSAAEPTWLEPGLLGALLAAAAGALLAETLRRARSRYVPGSGDRSDLAHAPVVHELRIRHLREQAEPDPGAPDIDDDRDLDDADPVGAVDVPDANVEMPQASSADDGWRDDAREVALTLAAARGLGLVGEGAPAAVRSLLVTALLAASDGSDHAVVVSADCWEALLGDVAPAATPGAVLVVETLDDALDAIERELLRRVRSSASDDEWPPLALVVEAPAADDPRLQSVLDNGAQVGVLGLLLGQWLPGVTAYVQADGMVTATSPGLGEHLRGARLFGLEAAEASTLLELLRSREPGTDPVQGRQNPVTDVLPDDNGLVADLPSNPVESPLRPDHHLAGLDEPEEPDAPRPIEIRVFGPPHVLLSGAPSDAEATDITSRIQPRVRELLVFLALHPAGVTREAVAAALWPASPPDRIGNAMNTSLSRLRRAVESATGGAISQIVSTNDNLLRIDSDLVTTDYEAFDAALRARRAATTAEERLVADQAVVDSYGGSLAEGMSTEWIENARAGIQRSALDAVASLARAIVDDDPRRTLDLLEIARVFEPHNEHIYRDIMRLQARLGQPDAVSRTLALLTTRLAEIDDRPAPGTVELAQHLTSADQPSRTRGQATAAV